MAVLKQAVHDVTISDQARREHAIRFLTTDCDDLRFWLAVARLPVRLQAFRRFIQRQPHTAPPVDRHAVEAHAQAS